ncbi:uncharacterized protein F4807DRAFT_457961 [Annulohypoxylon truncatum]|uniref:uncharacterized protein n=1 Tax=Annulohypoxylon truncatum TaxID=327061 RepID=UPI002008977E|nr:uncharacterized protein F4807DRAFT_457961 [Annulohypoxylon truncatum]KAI1212466.1 hypothetical protein F4807DRAFT_457961 [Annulohypoxylon truncatum]
MPAEGRITKPCPTCGGLFTLRSLREHLQSSHLGTFCFFPGYDEVRLEREDDARMTDALMRANEQQGGGPNRGGTEFVCCWQGCKQGRGHSYDRLTSLKRHLRTKQREEYRRYLNDASGGISFTAPQAPPQQQQQQQQINYQVLQAWNNLHVNVALLVAKFQCLEILVTPWGAAAGPEEEVGLGRLQRILDDVMKTDGLVDAAIEYVESVANSQKTAAGWEQLVRTRQEWHKLLSAWAYNADPNLDHFYEWACLNTLLGQMTQTIEQIKAC